ncbi:MAG: hypothetical protein R6U98_25375 [Pirellulaceae bacterium]
MADGPLYMANGVGNLSRWLSEPGARREGADGGLRITTAKPGRGIVTAFARDFSEATELRGEVVPETEDTEVQVTIENARTGELYEVATVEGEFRVNLGDRLPLKRLIKGLLYLRPVATGDEAGGALSVRLARLTMGWPILEVVSRLARAYERANPRAPKIRFEPGLTYRAAREMVTEGQAVGMLISEEINQMRAAIIFEAGLDGRGRGFENLKLNRFAPFAARIIRSETEQLAEVRLGLATDRVSPELEDFLKFVSSERGGSIIREVRFMKPVKRRQRPLPVKQAPYKPYKSGNTVTLEEPILTY